MLATAVSFAVAEQGEVARPRLMQAAVAVPAQMMAQPVITTGDAATDAKIKALQDEMEAKIKAIREEYRTKIDAAIGDKKVIGRGIVGTMMGTSTQGTGTRMIMRKEMQEDRREDRQDRREEAKAQGENVGYAMRNERANENAEAREGGIRGFFGRLFGR